jgi:uncharacterized alpha-E superfamily protein
VRTALSSQVWDALNTAFQEMQRCGARRAAKLSVNDLIDWTIRTTALVRGAIDDTQLRNDGYDFLHIGYHARTRRQHRAASRREVLRPAAAGRLRRLGPRQLPVAHAPARDVGAPRLHWAYGGEVTPARIAHFLILNPKCPRSLITCATEGMTHLDAWRAATAGGPRRRSAAARDAGASWPRSRVEDIFDEGLHEFLTRFIDEVAAIAAIIHDQYLSGEAR